MQVRVVWAVGGLFDTLSGAKKRAPGAWMRRARLEWLFRLGMRAAAFCGGAPSVQSRGVALRILKQRISSNMTSDAAGPLRTGCGVPLLVTVDRRDRP